MCICIYAYMLLLDYYFIIVVYLLQKQMDDVSLNF